MKTVSGKLVSTKPISLSHAAKLVSRFTAVQIENGTSPTVCAYLQRASDSFNGLVQFHKKLDASHQLRKHRPSQSIDCDVKVGTLSTAEENPQGEKIKDSEFEGRKGKRTANKVVDTAVVDGVKMEKRTENMGKKDEKNQKFDVKNVEIGQIPDEVVEKRKKKKKKKKKKEKCGEEKVKNEEALQVDGDGGESIDLGEQTVEKKKSKRRKTEGDGKS